MSKKHLQTIRFQELCPWKLDLSDKAATPFCSHYPKEKIGNLLIRNIEPIQPQSDQVYKQIRVKRHNGGIELRQEIQGSDIKTEHQFISRSGQFVLSRLDALNGGMGYLPVELDGAIVSSDILLYTVDQSELDPRYFLLLTTAPEFLERCKACSRGIANRQRIQEKEFLAIEIPLPALAEQRQKADRYDQLIAQVEQSESTLTELSEDIDNYLQEELGLKTPPKEIHKESFRRFHFSEIFERWNLSDSDHLLFQTLKQARYELIRLDAAYEFETGQTSASPGQEVLIFNLRHPFSNKSVVKLYENVEQLRSSDGQIIFSDKNNLNFLLEFLQSRIGIQQLRFYANGSGRIRSRKLRKIQIPLPPLNTQIEIADAICDIRLQMQRISQQILDIKKQAIAEFRENIFIE